MLLSISATSLAQVAVGAPPSDAEIRTLLSKRISDLSGGEKKVGIIVGLINPSGTRIISEGYIDENGLRKPDGNTVFEIASVTKVFSGLLLAQMVQKGEIDLNTPVSNYLPKDVKLPQQNGKQITMLDLATHTSGLAFMPDVAIENSKGLYDYLASCKLNTEIGKTWDYSNTGYWLMSEIISKKTGIPFEDAMSKEILSSLQLTSTGFKLSPSMRANLAVGLDASLQKAPMMVDVPNYKLMPAAGLLYSSVNDLLKVLTISMGIKRNALSPAIEVSLSRSRPISDKKKQALGWIILDEGVDQFIYHDGISAGYAGCIIYNPKKQIGVVVLSNQATDISDLAHHLLDSTFPLATPKLVKQTQLKLEPSKLSNYEGKFQTADGEVFTVSKKGESLQLESPPDWGLPVLAIHPESETKFFMKELPMKVIFNQEAGKIESIVIYPPRRNDGISAKRVR